MTTTVALLGTGLMGSGMARSMARAGLIVRAWNRTPEKAQPLREAGIELVSDPASAVRDADVVVTMLFDAESVEQVMTPLLPGIDGKRTVWAQCATIGVEPAERLARLAEEHGVICVDAPVLGTRAPAEQGTLTVLAGGPEAVRARVAPVFAAIGSRTIWVGERQGDGHRLKLVANAWVLSVTGATAQSIGLAQRFGLDPQLFLQVIAGGALDCGYTQVKGRAMIEGEFAPSFSLAGAAKDAALIAQAARDAGSEGSVMAALRACFQAAVRGEEGGRDEDMSAVVRAFS